MPRDCIVWSGESNMPEVDIKQCRVDIQKCTYVFGEEQSGSDVAIKQCGIGISDININKFSDMSVEKLSGSHMDIKPSDVKPSDIKSSDPVNINLPPSALKNVPVLTSLFST